jgi:hypothetical protein
MLLKMKYTALEDEVHAVGTLLHHAAQPGLNKSSLRTPFSAHLDRDVMIVGEGLDPVLVVGGLRLNNSFSPPER